MNNKKAKLTSLVLVLLVLGFSQLTRKSDADSEGQSSHRADVPAVGTSLAERLGADDNPAFMVHFTGDTHGTLEDCGCKGGGFGGLARRVGYMDALKAKFKNVPMLLVDSGNSFADERSTHGSLRIDAVVRNQWIEKAQAAYPVDVFNPSASDWRYVASLGEVKASGGKEKGQDLFKRLVSANVSSSSPALQPPAYVVREVPLAGQQKPARVAFVGLTETGITLPPGFTATDPIAAAVRVVPEARRNADVVIVLAHVPAATAVQVARAVEGISVIITGTGDFFTPPLKIDNTIIDFTPFETRSLGELRFYKDAQGKFTVRDRFILLDDAITQNAEAAALSTSTKEAGVNIYKEMQKVLQDWQQKAAGFTNMAPPKADSASKTASYSSAQACAQCHADQYLKWVNTKHGRTADSVMLKKDEFDVSCLQCHGSIRQSAEELPRFASLQCEQCHGPGSLHAIKPAKGYGKVDLKTACASCHTPQTSPKFDLQAAWLKIKH